MTEQTVSLHDAIQASLGQGPDKTFARLVERVGADAAARTVVKAGLEVVKTGLSLSDAVSGELVRAKEQLKQQGESLKALQRSCDVNAGQVAPLAAEVKALEGQVEALKEAKQALGAQVEQQAAAAEAKLASARTAVEDALAGASAAKADLAKAHEERLAVVAQAEGLRDMLLRLEGENAKLAAKAAQRDEFAAQLAALKAGGA